jgi:hypothetical protein
MRERIGARRLTAGLSERYVEVDKNACGRASFQPNA